MSWQSQLFVGLAQSRVHSRIPVVSFLQHLPPESRADCLLLNCGDPRNILFSIYCDERDHGKTRPGQLLMLVRDLDITCTDAEPAIIGMHFPGWANGSAQCPAFQSVDRRRGIQLEARSVGRISCVLY